MKIAIGCDHGGIELKQAIGEHLGAAGHEITDVGTDSPASVDYPDYGKAVAHLVAKGEVDRGVLVCGTGQGMAMTANKVDGDRAGVCGDVFSARMIRNHNNAQVLCLGARVTGPSLALAIVDAFIGADFEGGRHARRVEKIG